MTAFYYYLARARMSPSSDPVEAIPAGWLGTFVRACTEPFLRLAQCLVQVL